MYSQGIVESSSNQFDRVAGPELPPTLFVLRFGHHKPGLLQPETDYLDIPMVAG